LGGERLDYGANTWVPFRALLGVTEVIGRVLPQVKGIQIVTLWTMLYISEPTWRKN